ncbi:unnamed protein product [Candidula unifasciata]|uniref:Uncharacterized protein n=1 Tax=Candidula unifasciata TaxID=100452 RepID=A0A8S3ZXY6_9EUPU|nr:unnamed protein product [Candidula unifasciata]
MPKVKEINHPCHLLSLPSAKRFWCRHCMTVFEDAITRWHHSRSCRYGAVNNFMKRRELEVKALQNTAVLNPVEARIEQSIQMCDLATSSAVGSAGPGDEPQLVPVSDSFNCLICHQKFATMEEMRVHVKYPCSSSTVITSCASHPRHSVPVFIDAMPTQTSQWQLTSQHQQHEMHSTATFVHTQSQQLSSYDIDIQSQEEVESQCYDTEATYTSTGSSTTETITPTNIYVNEQGETVIEVENLDLNSEVGELSLAHLLTQLSQQGIVFDKTRSAELQGQHEVTVSVDASNTFYTTDESSQQASAIDEEEGQPTAEDAANTLAQLAGFRSFSRSAQIQSHDELQLHPDTHATQTYSYSSSANPNRQYTTKSYPHANVKYEYEYADSLSACDPSIVSTQQIVLHQAIESASQDYENVSLEQSSAQQYSNNSPNGAYAAELNTHQQIELEREAVASIESLKENFVVDADGAQSVLFSYPIQSSESGQLILNPAVTSAHLMHGEQAEYVVSGEDKSGSVELYLTSSSEGNTYITALNANVASDSQENTQPTVALDEAESHVEECHELQAQTISLQDFEDSESKAVQFVSQTLTPQALHSVDTDLGMGEVTDSCIKQEDQGNESSLVELTSIKEEVICQSLQDAPGDEIAEQASDVEATLTQVLPTNNVSA